MSKSKNKYWKIDPESPRTYRCIDRTPNTLAEELQLPTNTVRNRLKSIKGETENNFNAYPSSDFQELQRQIYHFEGIPILSAYLKRKGLKRFTERTRNDLPSFMSQLEAYLDEHPEQTFCRKFLYGQKEYKKYLYEHHLYRKIAERLRCIENLSRITVLDVNGLLDSDELENVYFPSVLPNVLERLDQLILEMANYADFEHFPSAAQKSQDLNQVDKIVEEWYKALCKKRKQISQNGIIELPRPWTATKEELAEALNERLIKETLDQENKKIGQMEKLLEYAAKHSPYHYPLDKHKKKQLQRDIQELMNYNRTSFLESAFSVSNPVDFQWPEKCKVPDELYGTLKDWFAHAMQITFKLQQLIPIIFVLSEMRRTIKENYIQHMNVWEGRLLRPLDSDRGSDFFEKIIEQSKESVQVFWKEMRQAGYIRRDASFEYTAAIDSVAGIRKIVSDKKTLVDFLASPMTQRDVQPEIVLEGCMVTIGYFWEKHAEASAKYYAKQYEQYLEAFHNM